MGISHPHALPLPLFFVFKPSGDALNLKKGKNKLEEALQILPLIVRDPCINLLL